MKAIRVESFGEPSVLKYVTNQPIPKPSGNQILIKLFTAGVNPVETYIRAGGYSRLPELPYTPGSDGAGVIIGLGDKVSKRLKINQKVYTMRALTGTYAEYCLANDQHVFELGNNLSFDAGASLGIPYLTAHRALFILGNAKKGQSVLVHGASGAVGIASCQIANAYGMQVYGTAGTEEGIELVKQNGATHCFNHRTPNYMKDIMKITGNKGVDFIIEMLANVNLQSDLTILNDFGLVLIVGCRDSINFNPRLTMAKELRVQGVAFFHGSDKDIETGAVCLNKGMLEGWLKPVVDKTVYTLEDTPKAQKDVIEHANGSKGKIVLKINSN